MIEAGTTGRRARGPRRLERAIRTLLQSNGHVSLQEE